LAIAISLMQHSLVTILMLLTALTAVAETRVRITGLKDKSENQALEMMGGRLTHVHSSPASPPLADDAAFLLRQILRKDGYAEATVDWKIAGRNEIVLTVREGGRLSLGKVKVNGVPEDDPNRLAKLYSRPAEKDRPLGAGPPPFRENDVETGLSFLRQEFNSRGYWLAEAAIASRSTDPATGAVALSIDVRKGGLFKIARPTVTASADAARSLAVTAAQPFIGLPATTGNLNKMRLAVQETVVGQGYPDATIRMTQTLESTSFVPGFVIELGQRVRLNRIHIEGLEITRQERIEARVKSMEGDWYDEDAMNKRLRELLATGAFSAARAETTAIGEDLVDATLHFDEARAREVSLAAGFGSYLGLITRVTYGNRNLAGRLLGFDSGFELSSRGLLGDARITDPWVLGSDVSASVHGFALIYGREGYETLETGFDASVTWKFGDHYKLDLLAGSSVVNVSEEGLPSSALGETAYSNPKIRLTQTLDYRDNPVLPTKGWHLENPLELGAAVGDLSTSYIKAGLSGGWYHELNRLYQIGVGGEWGMLVPSGDGDNLPIDLRLFNGGARSVRSFPERELGPSANGYPTGGEAMWNTNLELIRAISGSAKAVAFLDAGALSRDIQDIGSSEVELAAGLGVRFDLPIGPVRLEYGYNLTRGSGEPVGTIHFAIGCAY
jgi:outer membrane protein insertion porin family